MKELLRRVSHRLPSIESVVQDLGYAVRGFRREPGFTIIAVLILALGIGANTAVFSVISPLLLRRLPFPEPEKLAWLSPDPVRAAKNGRRVGMSDLTYTVGVFEMLQRESHSFASLSAYNAFFGYTSNTLTGRGDPERVVGVEVAQRFFEVLGVQPSLGRLFTREELAPNGPRALLMEYRFWERRFNADPSIIGQTVNINNTPVAVAGVLPSSFDFSSTFTPGVRVDYFTPLDLNRIRNDGHTLAIVGRVTPGATPQSAHAELAALMPRLEAAPDHPRWWNMSVMVTALQDHIAGQLRRSLIVLWSAVGMVLLIVCANLSNLLLARAAARRKEIAVRIALGAGRGRVVRQLLTEGATLSLAGAALGVPLAYALTAAVRANTTLSIPLLHQMRVDGTALLFTAGLAIAAALIFGLLPAVRLAGRDPHVALKEQSRGSTDGRGAAWLRSTLVIAEVTLACVLLVGAGLLMRSFVELLRVDLGFRPSQVFAMRIDAGVRKDGTDEQRRALVAEVVRRVRAIPGVEAAGTTDALPLDRNRQWGLSVPGRQDPSGENPSPFVYVVGPGYFKAMGIAVKKGRDFGEEDTATRQPVIVLSEGLARRLFGTQPPLGRLLNGDPKNPYRVVGVVADVRQTSLEEGAMPQMYVAETQYDDSAGSADLIVRTSLPAASLASSVRATIGSVDPSLTSTDFRPIEMLVERTVSPRRFLLTLLGAFSALALVLACLGIYGVVSYGVSQRVQEIGVRMALGATAGHVSRQVIGGTVKLAIIGIALGLALSLLAAHVIASLLFGTSPNDVATFTATATILIVVAIVAGAIPALRAARIDPMTALRAE